MVRKVTKKWSLVGVLLLCCLYLLPCGCPVAMLSKNDIEETHKDNSNNMSYIVQSQENAIEEGMLIVPEYNFPRRVPEHI